MPREGPGTRGGGHSRPRIPNLLTFMALIHRVRAMLPDGRALLYNEIGEAYLETIDTFRGLQEMDFPLHQKMRWLGQSAIGVDTL